MRSRKTLVNLWFDIVGAVTLMAATLAAVAVVLTVVGLAISPAIGAYLLFLQLVPQITSQSFGIKLVFVILPMLAYAVLMFSLC